MISITLARTVYETSGPPNAFGTLIDQRPLCEKASSSAIGLARVRSRSEALAAKTFANASAMSIASRSEPTTCAARCGRGRPGTPAGFASFGFTAIVIAILHYRKVVDEPALGGHGRK